MKLFKRREDPSTLLVIGLGNHGSRYKNNRHNIGFMVVDHLAEAWGEKLEKKQSRSLITTYKLSERKIILAKPQTFMNESGRSAQALLNYYRISPDRMMVIFDDLDLPLGTIRMRPSGGTGGHRGMRSIQQTIRDQGYPRMRMGIGRPPGKMDPADYVLQNFTNDELEIVEATIERARLCLLQYMENGLDEAMNICNTSASAP